MLRLTDFEKQGLGQILGSKNIEISRLWYSSKWKGFATGLSTTMHPQPGQIRVRPIRLSPGHSSTCNTSTHLFTSEKVSHLWETRSREQPKPPPTVCPLASLVQTSRALRVGWGWRQWRRVVEGGRGTFLSDTSHSPEDTPTILCAHSHVLHYQSSPTPTPSLTSENIELSRPRTSFRP